MEKIQVGTGKDAAGEYQYGKGGKAGMLRYTGILLEKQSLGGRQAKGHNGKNVERAGGGRLLFAAETGPSGTQKLFLQFFMLEVNLKVMDIKFLEDFME